MAIFGRVFDHVPVRVLTSDIHHRTLRVKVYKIRENDYGVQVP